MRKSFAYGNLVDENDAAKRSRPMAALQNRLSVIREDVSLVSLGPMNSAEAAYQRTQIVRAVENSCVKLSSSDSTPWKGEILSGRLEILSSPHNAFQVPPSLPEIRKRAARRRLALAHLVPVIQLSSALFTD
uniref:Uncharacterized protein n=1 Tax=Steinernema glaseri TaxID=37863 RepID=A0A1I7XYP4_9BILA